MVTAMRMMPARKASPRQPKLRCLWAAVVCLFADSSSKAFGLLEESVDTVDFTRTIWSMIPLCLRLIMAKIGNGGAGESDEGTTSG